MFYILILLSIGACNVNPSSSKASIQTLSCKGSLWASDSTAWITPSGGKLIEHVAGVHLKTTYYWLGMTGRFDALPIDVAQQGCR